MNRIPLTSNIDCEMWKTMGPEGVWRVTLWQSRHPYGIVASSPDFRTKAGARRWVKKLRAAHANPYSRSFGEHGHMKPPPKHSDGPPLSICG